MEKLPFQKLQSELEAATAQMKQMLPQEVLDAFEISIRELRESGAGTGLELGTQAPDFTLIDHTGNIITLSEETAKGPVVLTFYRGAWCSFCNLQLLAYQRIWNDIQAAGAQLIAVSPQTPDQSIILNEKNQFSFLLLSDVHNQTAEKYNLKFRLPDHLHDIYRSLGITLDAFNGDHSWELPVPATFVIDTARIIRAAQADADYKKRMEPAEIIQILNAISS
ncbi:alkyl hydroperoxide reductase [Paenibacillus elgii]|uniref:thioredoxin-dependent peroxiredoxin n=1 Tax=Paenibacillus elgii TaxID=189691 RepID=A0A2T6FT81_9BACL|nr:peroxiredoxin-like family protein [Paenibacillus elgii]PUA35106.1 alkyl hydroperoxide reductase [Paenibacillus elgii]